MTKIAGSWVSARARALWLLVLGLLVGAGFVAFLALRIGTTSLAQVPAATDTELRFHVVAGDSRTADLLALLEQRLNDIPAVSVIYLETWQQHPEAAAWELERMLETAGGIGTYKTHREVHRIWYAAEGARWRLESTEVKVPLYVAGSTGTRPRGAYNYKTVSDGVIMKGIHQGGVAMDIAASDVARGVIPQAGYEAGYLSLLFGIPYYNLRNAVEFKYAGEELYSAWVCHRLHAEGVMSDRDPAVYGGPVKWQTDVWITKNPPNVPVGYEFRINYPQVGTGLWQWKVESLHEALPGWWVVAKGGKAFWPAPWTNDAPEVTTTWQLQGIQAGVPLGSEVFDLTPPAQCLVENHITGEVYETGP